MKKILKPKICVKFKKKAGAALIKYLKNIYKSSVVIRHKDTTATANDIIWELKNGKLKIEINDVAMAVKCLEDAKQQNNSLYWILYKIVNKE